MKGFFLFFLLTEYILTSRLSVDIDATSKVIGILHHLPALKNACGILADTSFWQDPIHHTTKWSHIMVHYTLAYFMFDVVFLMKHHWPPKRSKLVFYLHAVSCAIAYEYIAQANKYHFYGAAFITWEFSTIFLYNAWLLSRLHKERTFLYKLNGLCLVSSFFVFRIVLGSFVIYKLAWPLMPWPLRVLAISMTYLNLFWFGKILTKFKTALT